MRQVIEHCCFRASFGILDKRYRVNMTDFKKFFAFLLFYRHERLDVFVK